MKKYLVLMMMPFLLIGQANAKEAYNPIGLWLTENERSAIQVENCGDKLCGYIAWIIDGGMQIDAKNPEEKLQGQPMCGLQIMQGLQQSESNANKWDDGKIYKADDGDIYDASLKMNDADNLTVRGYMGISLLGKSQKWKRVRASDYPQCKKP